VYSEVEESDEFEYNKLKSNKLNDAYFQST